MALRMSRRPAFTAHFPASRQRPSRSEHVARSTSIPPRVIETAVGVTIAVDILSANTLSEAADRSRCLIEGQNADTGPAELRSCTQDERLAAAVVIKASSRRLGPELQLRYRSSTSSPQPPDREPEQVAHIAAALPHKMWRTWSRILLPSLPVTDARRAELTIATLIVGSTVRPVDAAKMVGEVATANALNQRLSGLCASPHWHSISAALIRLSAYRADCGSPIDYTRRRCLDYTALLQRDDWVKFREEVDDDDQSDDGHCSTPLSSRATLRFDTAPRQGGYEACWADVPRHSQVGTGGLCRPRCGTT